MIVDNDSPHKQAEVKAWLAGRPRWYVHFTPTDSSWLNLVEPFFGLITDKTIRHGSFCSVQDLVAEIDYFIDHYNQNCKPFTWTVSTDFV